MRSFKIFEQIWTHSIHGILCNFSPFNVPPPTPSLSSYASKYLLCLSSPADYSTSPSQPGRWLCLDRNERPKPHSLPPSDSALLSTLPRILLKRASSAGKEFGRGNISEQFSMLMFFLPQREALLRSQPSSVGRIKEELKKTDSGWMAKSALGPHQTSRVKMARIGKRAGKDTMLRIGKKSGNWPLAIGPLGQVFKMWPYNLNFPESPFVRQERGGKRWRQGKSAFMRLGKRSGDTRAAEEPGEMTLEKRYLNPDDSRVGILDQAGSSQDCCQDSSHGDYSQDWWRKRNCGLDKICNIVLRRNGKSFQVLFRHN